MSLFAIPSQAKTNILFMIKFSQRLWDLSNPKASVIFSLKLVFGCSH